MPINMSYCRFSNTFQALKECFNGDEPESDEERKYMLKLIKLCVKVANQYSDEVEDQ